MPDNSAPLSGSGGSSGGGDSGGSSGGYFLTDADDDGFAATLRWDRLFSAAIGVILGVTGIKLADLVDAMISIPVALYRTTVNVASDLVGALVGGPTVLIDTAARAASAFARQFGPLGFVVALAVVVGTAYLAARVREVSG